MLPASQDFNRRRARIIRAVLAVSSVTLLLLAVIGIRLVDGIDEQTRIHEQAMVARGLDLRMNELEQAITPQVDWDDAVTHMGGRLDGAWADAYFGGFMHTQVGATRAFVVNGQGLPVYAARNGRPFAGSPARGMAPFAPAVEQMVADLRRRETPAARSVPANGSALARAVHTTSLARAEGGIWMLSGHLIQPDSDKVIPVPGPLSVALVAVPLDKDVLTRFGQRYRIGDLAIAFAPPSDSRMARIELHASDGQALAWMAWTPRRPGAELMRAITLPMALLLFAFATGAVIFLREASKITRELIASEARARHVASHDQLTGLPNRALMFDRLRTVLAMARRRRGGMMGSDSPVLAIHCLDLDRFKGVNDTLGHHAGDELIQQVAQMLIGLCRESDTVARLGGDEFVILQPGATPTAASHLAQRVVAQLTRPFALTFGTVEIGCSIGVTIVSDASIDASEALRQADLALYASKEGGRGCTTFFEPEMHAALRLRRSLETDLRRALSFGDLTMVYQVQVDDRGRLRGVEALARWTHSERGVIMPGVFVPLAEESGLIHELGDYILTRVFAETRHWHGLSVAINISALQLRSPAFMTTMRQMIERHAIDPERYDLEITETALLGEDGVTRDNLVALAEAGFTITLDDFGTGYSSLANLRRFAVDKIKIDRSFVQNIDTDQEAEALVEAIVRLGLAMKLEIVAEGVETEAQRQRLIQCGCHQFQGYLLGRPVPAGELERAILLS
ncbi:MAG: EAL domain-containing protein [Sphingomonadales bacterium]|nr:EAL domain-containing protein [Sphingomonadales bacterium]MDE2170379.1 EAL domain-containing protein [Sphingomonadales bacterium]